MLSDLKLRVAIECFILQRIVTALPALPARRELLIQNAKLLRMAVKSHPKDGDPLRLLGGGSLAKMKKRRAGEAKEIGEQRKKVRTQTDKYFKEFLRGQRGSLTNAEYRVWKTDFDLGMKQHHETILKEVSEKVALELANPYAKRTSRGRAKYLPST